MLTQSCGWLAIHDVDESDLAANSPVLVEEGWLRIKKISRSIL